MIDKFFNFLGLEKKVIADRPISDDFIQTQTTWKKNNEDRFSSSFENHIKHGFTNSIVFSCLTRKSQSALQVGVKTFRGTADNFEVLDSDHEFSKLFRRPNNIFSWSEFQQLMSLYLDLDGNIFIYKYKSNPSQKKVESLYLLMPSNVVVVKEDEKLLGYLYKPDINKKAIPFLPDEIIHIKYPNPINPYGRGVSPLNSIITSVHLDNQNTSFLNTFFQNAAVPFGLLKSKQRLNDPEIGRIRERIRSQYAGSFNWHDIMILDSDAEYQRLGLNLKELEFSVLDFRNEARICSALGVPPAIAGARVGIENNTYSNYEEARKSFWEDGLLPMYAIFQSGLNNGFSNEFDGNYYFEYDFSNVPALLYREKETWNRALNGLSAGILTLNEARKIIGYDEIETEDIQSVSDESKSESSENESKSLLAEYKNFNLILDNKAKRFIIETPDKLNERIEIENKHSKLLLSSFRKQKNEILDYIKSSESPNTQDAINIWSSSQQILIDAVQRMLMDSSLFGARFSLDVIEEFLGVNEKEHYINLQYKNLTVGSWDLINAQALEWVGDYTFDLVSGLDSTTTRMLSTALDTWINNGLNITELNRSLEPIFGAKRARTIARTEVTRAYSEGNLITFRESGVVDGVQIRNPQDERTCPQCGPLAGITFDNDGNIEPVDQQTQQLRGIISGLDNVEFTHPGGNSVAGKFKGEVFSHPPVHVNCRCWLVPVIN